MSKIDTLLERLGGIRAETGEKAVQAKSRDFYWYSPILKRKLDHIIGDVVVCPTTEAEVMKVLAACHALGIPVTPRGAGTGNYGQAMPLAGGVVLDLRGLDEIKAIKPGAVVCGAGALMGDIDEACKAEGQELRMHPSTKETATIGGFVAGGSGGVGSVRWGALRDPGNIIRVRVATMEGEPKLVELTGRDVMQVQHAYGVTGVITEVEFALTPKVEWVELMLASEDWLGLNDLCDRVLRMDGLLLKELATVQAPAPHRYFLRHKKFLEEAESVAIVMAAPNAVDWMLELAAEAGARVAYRSDEASPEDLKALPHAHHLAWNHTTLRGLRVDPEITYLQTGYPAEGRLEKIAEIARLFPGEVIGHNEFFRSGGQDTCAGLTMVRFSTEDRLREIIAAHEALGCLLFSPHHYTVEEGGMKTTDPLHLDVKKRHDPDGLLNPGKMIGWEDPHFDYAADYAYPGMRPAPAE
ncbi:FAD-binding oxidoreductase [Rhodovulum sp. DZ06]|uniref:FAD-binding oxidoreductase n=1 Tax=Rhodovulum sp. DZ06 TaxID=3425126 RepID=UPI003D325AB9